MGNKKRVAVIFGGQSSEHEVSRVSAQSIIKEINTEKFDVVMIGITKDGRWLNYDGPVDRIGDGGWEKIAHESRINAKVLAENIGKVEDEGVHTQNKEAGVVARNILKDAGAETENSKVDVIFPVLHGCNGEDGTIQGLFELSQIPYVGCGVLASAIGMDKGYAKIVFESEGIPQGKYLVFNRKQIAQDFETIQNKVQNYLSYPCFVKPSNAGSSVGVSKARNAKELEEALVFAAKYDRRILVEEFIDCREVECAVLGNDEPIASTVGEVVPSNEFYDYNAKYIDNSSEIMIPANLPEETIAKIREYAVRAYKSLDCAGLSRVDFFVHKKTGEIFINEINTLPGFTSVSMYPKLWEATGIPYKELIERLIELALQRFEDTKRAY